MQMCSDGHREVVYEDKEKCPVCELMKELDAVLGTIKDKEVALDAADDEIRALKDKLAGLE